MTLALAPELTADGPVADPLRSGQAAGKHAQTIADSAAAKSKRRSQPKRSPPAISPTAQQLSTGVYDIASDNTNVFAATEEGLLTSANDGLTWNRARSASGRPWQHVAAGGSLVVLADLKAVAVSSDKGSSFRPLAAPAELTMIAAVTIDSDSRIWIAGREGVYLSEDGGSTWHSQKDLFVPDVSGLYFDQANSRILVTSNQPGSLVFAVHLQEMTVSHWQPGWVLREARPVGDHLVGITRYDGVVLQPAVVASQEISATK